jgi:hypothetical protein
MMNTSMPEPNTLWIIAAAVLFIGLTAALVGRRPLATSGRRCGRCGYDLNGSPNTIHRCPECGIGLAGNVVTGGNSESDIRWRRRLRRGGYAIGTLAVLIGLVTAAIDSRRVPVMPTWWLVNIEAPLAARSNGDGVGWTEAVYATLSHRLGACNGTGDIAAMRSVAEPILDRINRTSHGGRWGRTFLLFAWDEGALTDEELAGIDLIWPKLEIVGGDGCSVDGLDLLESVECPFDTPPLAGTRLRIEGSDGVVRVGTSSVSIGGSSGSEWPWVANRRLGKIVSKLVSPWKNSIALPPGEHRVEAVRRFELIADDDRVLGSREIEFHGDITIPEPSALPDMSTDPDLLARIADGFRSSSWVTRDQSGWYRISLAVPPGDLLSAGTPTFTVLDATNPHDDRAIWPEGPNAASDIRAMAGPWANPPPLQVRRPIGAKEWVKRIPGMPVPFHRSEDEDVTSPSTFRIRLDATTLDPRLWRALLLHHPSFLTPPNEVPAGVVEFEIPVIDEPYDDIPREGTAPARPPL